MITIIAVHRFSCIVEFQKKQNMTDIRVSNLMEAFYFYFIFFENKVKNLFFQMDQMVILSPLSMTFQENPQYDR